MNVRTVEPREYQPDEIELLETIARQVAQAIENARLYERSQRRVAELEALGSISQRMLTLTLRGLERDGLVTRTVFRSIPPRVDYELTQRGRSLLDPVSGLGLWARQNRAAIETARQRFDKAASAAR